MTRVFGVSRHARLVFQAICAGSLVLGSSGCSLLFVKAREPGGGGRCTRSQVAPVLDSLVTVGQMVRTGYAIGAPDSAYHDAPLSREADIALGATFATVFLASAVYGFSSVDACATTKQRSDESPYDDLSALPSRSTSAGPAQPSPPRSRPKVAPSAETAPAPLPQAPAENVEQPSPELPATQ